MLMIIRPSLKHVSMDNKLCSFKSPMAGRFKILTIISCRVTLLPGTHAMKKFLNDKISAKIKFNPEGWITKKQFDFTGTNYSFHPKSYKNERPVPLDPPNVLSGTTLRKTEFIFRT